MSVKKLIILFNDHSVVDIVEEYTQLDYINAVGPENPDVLTHEQDKKALRAVSLNKEKL